MYLVIRYTTHDPVATARYRIVRREIEGEKILPDDPDLKLLADGCDLGSYQPGQRYEGQKTLGPKRYDEYSGVLRWLGVPLDPSDDDLFQYASMTPWRRW